MYVPIFPKQLIAAVLALTISTGALAGGKHGGDHGQVTKIGEPGKASEATRIIEIVMTDNRFEPERISIEKGQTIRFVLKNEGEFVHEFNIGTAKMHAKHQEEMVVMFEHGVLEVDKIHRDLMKMDMGDGRTMDHNDPNSVLLEPGSGAEMVWRFASSARLEFACNIPGHYDVGMMGDIRVR